MKQMGPLNWKLTISGIFLTMDKNEGNDVMVRVIIYDQQKE